MEEDVFFLKYMFLSRKEDTEKCHNRPATDTDVCKGIFPFKRLLIKAQCTWNFIPASVCPVTVRRLFQIHRVIVIARSGR
jgi:hypothetical protein